MGSKYTEAAVDRADASSNDSLLSKRAELVQLTTDAIIVRSFEGRIAFWSRGAETLYGWPAEAAIGRTTHDLFAPRFPVALSDIHQELLREGTWHGELEHRAHDGRVITVLSRWKLLPGTEGEPAQVFESNIDITARVEAEHALHQLSQELEETIVQRAAELSDANAELQEFADTIGHELRAPLRGITGFATALLEDESPRLSDVGRRHAERIVAAAHKMDRLVQDLVAYSRLSRAGVVLSPTSINVVLTLVLQDLDSDIQATGASIRVPPAMPEVMAQRSMLQQVLTHLLANALRFVPQGIVPEIQVAAEERGSCLRVTVTDNGVGIDPKYHERIFRPFERLHGEDSHSGTGIGLAVVQRALSRMHGRVGVESTGQGGSRFWFELERVRAPA